MLCARPKLLGFSLGATVVDLKRERNPFITAEKFPWGHPDSGNTRRNVRTVFHDTQARRGQIRGCSGITGLKSFRLHVWYCCTELKSVFGALRDMVLLGKKRYVTLLIMLLKDFKELLDVEVNIFEDVLQCHNSVLEGRDVLMHWWLWKNVENYGTTEK